ncbi:N-acetylglucosamine-6-phosphate deacetylase [Pontibaca sp. S1109L]|uniref:N-acetylglucosamine-6-phosphate deacetylase n=2 Tax=Pontibaca salina TaxID=2795731 RepID=A0A934M1L8_9RHOB|nr:N-acetylglucosamine-6-phosphate deacetylase [Pontibaca salina]
MGDIALLGADIHDGETLHRGRALLRRAGHITVVKPEKLPADCLRRDLGGGTLLPGFVDLQVNGGGGVMFNDDPSVATLRKIAKAHVSTGTNAFLPTLITDTPALTTAAITAVLKALAQNVPGIIGLHLEGPHLARARKGAHDPALIRPMEPADLAQLEEAAENLPNLMLTVAPESVTPDQIARLSRAGAIVSLGHTEADYATARSYFDAGVRCVTHLYNAMPAMLSRAPGLIGAALEDGRVSAGLIADGYHVHPATMRAALGAKRGPSGLFLVTDAMATIGSNIGAFTLNGRRITRAKGRLTLSDGTLAGADLEMAQALRVLVQDVGEDLQTAIRRATCYPARLLRDARGHGALSSDNIIHLNRDLHLTGTAESLWAGR